MRGHREWVWPVLDRIDVQLVAWETVINDARGSSEMRRRTRLSGFSVCPTRLSDRRPTFVGSIVEPWRNRMILRDAAAWRASCSFRLRTTDRAPIHIHTAVVDGCYDRIVISVWRSWSELHVAKTCEALFVGVGFR